MSILKEIEAIKVEIESSKPSNTNELELFRLGFLSKKGKIPALFQRFREVSAEDRKEVGRVLNLLKQSAEEKFQNLKEALSNDSEKKIGRF